MSNYTCNPTDPSNCWGVTFVFFFKISKDLIGGFTSMSAVIYDFLRKCFEKFFDNPTTYAWWRAWCFGWGIVVITPLYFCFHWIPLSECLFLFIIFHLLSNHSNFTTWHKFPAKSGISENISSFKIIFRIR